MRNVFFVLVIFFCSTGNIPRDSSLLRRKERRGTGRKEAFRVRPWISKFDRGNLGFSARCFGSVWNVSIRRAEVGSERERERVESPKDRPTGWKTSGVMFQAMLRHCLEPGIGGIVLSERWWGKYYSMYRMHGGHSTKRGRENTTPFFEPAGAAAVACSRHEQTIPNSSLARRP